MKIVKSAQFWACLLVLLFVAGCTTYYRVTDQSTRKAYYTTDIDRRGSGAVQFYDVKSRANVTLQSSEIIEIAREAFDSGIKE